MAHPSHRPDMFRWKRFSKPGTQTNTKVHLTDGDINTWIKKVEMASEFAVSEVFSTQKPRTGKLSRTVALQSMDQLQDHDDAYSEAQTILSDWMNKKLRLELEMDEEDEEEEQTEEEPAKLNYTNFNDMYSQLAAEDESFEVRHFLQDLMEIDVMDRKTVQGLRLDVDDEKKRGPDPNVTMEIRHKQVKERRAQRDAEWERQRREQEAQREALEEAKRLECKEQRRRKQEAQRQEELLQQEVVRLRREMQEKKRMEQLARKRERERLEKQNTSVKNTITPKPDFVTQRQLCHREQEVEAKVHILNLQCMQKHFSTWYSVVLEKRVRLGKAAALCDWRRQLRAWRAWRALVWVRRKEREAERTEEELRLENRRGQLAEESDRRRLLRRCLSDWRLWCRMEREWRELFSQQEETRQKMATLIDAAASGKLTTKNCTEPPITVQPESVNQSESTAQLVQVPVQRATSAPPPPTLTDRRAAPPTQAWQVTRRHAALSSAEAREGRRPSGAPRCQSAETRGGRFEHRHMAQQRTIAEQKRLLKEQQDIISELQEKQNLLELKQEAEKAEQLAVQLKPSASQNVIKTSHGSKGSSGESNTRRPAPKEYDSRLASPHPALRAMEERARQRVERRREVEEMKRRREEEKLAQMKAEEEKRLRQEEEEKRVEAERRREERRQKKEREMEKQRRTELEQKLLKQAGEHYHRSLLLHRGITPWRRLVEQSHANAQTAVAHHTQVLQRRCLMFWLHTTGEALAKKKSQADQLYECILLRRALYSWKMFKHLQSHLEVQAEHFYTTRTQRKVFKALLDHAIHQRLEAWDREQQADEYRARRVVSRCFSAWRRLPEALQEERAREERREQLRRKVAEIIPDFRSSPLDTMWKPPSHI
ncbi:coiled-coil domain-containing protein 191 isoform X1 [Ictalurus furcatus]|uniref:coiled-coil domain-containing protein 191 isoform X1 n=1 Tax=Ictalurus furcatus TaxID=66913 RepID=UPI00235079F0|nr:coiled-coil domain-containing protein 191 isoform X1 [Ictalurus furcatus]XP_053467454.1 coiled-coil domain-containing protein 191 isoform X1 [Ictalurus furcatus]